MVLHNGSMQHFACRSGSQDALFNFNSSVVERGDDAMASASKLTAVMCEKIVEDLRRSNILLIRRPTVAVLYIIPALTTPQHTGRKRV